MTEEVAQRPARKAKRSLEERQAENLAQGRPRNAGLPWTDAAREELVTFFRRGTNIAELVKRFERTQGALVAELTRQGLITEEGAAELTRASEKKPSPAEMPSGQLAKRKSVASSVHADRLLAAWTTLEVLSPQAVKDRKELDSFGQQLIDCDEDPVPWLAKSRGRCGKEKALYWFLCVGKLDLARATVELQRFFPDERGEEQPVKGATSLVVLVLDEVGRPVSGKVHLTSFGWGYGKISQGKLADLAAFPDEEQSLCQEIEECFFVQDQEGQLAPFTQETVQRLLDWLVERLGVPPDAIAAPSFAIRVPVKSAKTTIPEPEWLNSFFIEDLAAVRAAFRSGNVGAALGAYVEARAARPYKDILIDQTLLEETVAPARLPLSRWPGDGRYPLALMQQVAVNHIAEELRQPGLAAVNGPPGTGKTTLLRDVVAKVVLDRALVLAGFDDPRKAFRDGVSVQVGSYSLTTRELDKRLLGHEIVVASSNNKAVENISGELPGIKALAAEFLTDGRYFQTVSEGLARRAQEQDEQPDHAEELTWGLAAAVLGNKSNCQNFVDGFWFDTDYGLSRYFRFMEGQAVPPDSKGNLPLVIEREAAAGPGETLRQWQRTRSEFLERRDAVQALLHQMSDAQAGIAKLAGLDVRERELQDEISASESRLARTVQDIQQLEQRAGERNQALQEAKHDQAVHVQLRPHWLFELFRTGRFRWWSAVAEGHTEAVRQAREALGQAKKELERTEAEQAATDEVLARLRTQFAKVQADQAQQHAAVAAGRALAGPHFADDAFWKRPDAELQATAPWLCEQLQQARDELFVASWRLHKAFIDAAAEQLRPNLAFMMDVLKGRHLTELEESLLPSLWASLCLMVPVISTTFASVGRLFGRLGCEAIGWLLVDEAGQATPQAAIGALYRAKRAVVIGDPLQIEPVSSVPRQLVKAIFREFDLEPERWAAPEASAQYLADQAGWLGASIPVGDGELWVGAPLRVHRRCEEPMFSVANRVAYNGLMISATKTGASPIGDIIGPSQWFDVAEDPAADEKWSPAEGRIALQCLHKLLHDDHLPDVYFITPFRTVGFKLRELFASDELIKGRIGGALWKWLGERVGTVHTFQGKEAEAVFFVLGASTPQAAGARSWAGGAPNLANVALTRAKKRFYVIGNYGLWRNVGVFREVARGVRPLAADRH